MENINIGTYAFGMGSDLDVAGKLKAAKAMGYTGIEFLAADLQNNSEEDLRKALEEAGMECVSLHAQMDLIEELLPKFAALGGKMIICPSYQFADKAEAIALAKELEKKGELARKYGVNIGYHNHRSEFFVDEGKPILEYVIENSDPQLVSFQLDCGWATAAGVDCPAFIRKYSGRFCSVHVKECSRVLGVDTPTHTGAASNRPPMKFDENGKPIFSEEMKAMMAKMREMTSCQCPMGDPSSIISWKDVKAATDAQGVPCAWTVEREYDYAGNMNQCLEEDARWLKANL